MASWVDVEYPPDLQFEAWSSWQMSVNDVLCAPRDPFCRSIFAQRGGELWKQERAEELLYDGAGEAKSSFVGNARLQHQFKTSWGLEG